MKKRAKIPWKFILLLIAAFGSYSTFSAEGTIDTAGLAFGGGAGAISLGGGYFHELYPWLQAGGGLNYQTLEKDGAKVSQTRLKAGLQFNMDGGLPSAFFLGLGLTKRSSLGGYLQFGKRISLGQSISLRPNFEVLSAGGTTIVFNILSASYFF